MEFAIGNLGLEFAVSPGLWSSVLSAERRVLNACCFLFFVQEGEVSCYGWWTVAAGVIGWIVAGIAEWCGDAILDMTCSCGDI
jgi:hypothetical protein